MLENSHPFARAINGSLRGFATDLRALEDAIVKASDNPVHQEIVQMSEDAAEFFPRLRSTLEEHVALLDAIIGVHDEGGRKIGASPSPAFGFPPASRIPFWDPCTLLSDYCAKLHLVAMGYVMLHARSVALHDVDTAKIALTHLREIVPFFNSICDAAPRLAVQELSRHFGGLTPGAAETAVANTRDAWSQYALAGSVH
jgi:hypothetical protein